MIIYLWPNGSRTRVAWAEATHRRAFRERQADYFGLHTCLWSVLPLDHAAMPLLVSVHDAVPFQGLDLVNPPHVLCWVIHSCSSVGELGECAALRNGII